MRATPEEQVALRALYSLSYARSRHLLTSSLLPLSTMVYYFKGGENPTWESFFVCHAENHLVLISSKLNHKVHAICTAYKDVRLIPNSTLLPGLDEQEFLFPLPQSIFDDDVATSREVGADDAAGNVVQVADDPPSPYSVPDLPSHTIEDAVADTEDPVVGLTPSPDDGYSNRI